MRINFQGNFKELEKVVKTEARGVEKGVPPERFEQLLSSLSPDRPISAVNSESQATARASLNIPRTAPMTAWRLAPGEPFTPPLDRLGVTLEPKIEQTPQGGGVKTPTLVSARRLSSSPEQTTSSVQVEEIKHMVTEAGKKHGVDPALGMAVATAESSLNHRAVSADGHASKGLFQLLDSTGNHLWKNAGLEHPYDPFNPKQNIDLGVGYLRYLHDIFSQEKELPNKLTTVAAANSSSLEKLAVAAFNAGEGRVASAQMRARKAGEDPADYTRVAPYLPDSTQEYVNRVFDYRSNLSKGDEQE